MSLWGRLPQDKLRFILGGISNTLLSYMAYLLLLYVLPYRSAFTIAYALGIITGYAINTLWVFRKPWSWRSLTAYPLIPLITYFASLLIVQFTVERLGIDARLAPLLATLAVLPITFMATRWLIHRGAA